MAEPSTVNRVVEGSSPSLSATAHVAQLVEHLSDTQEVMGS
jgi:hypothetical protein